MIASVPRARVLSFVTNNSTGTAGRSTAYSSFILLRWSVLPCIGNYILLSGDLITLIVSILTLHSPCLQRVGQNEKGLWKHISFYIAVILVIAT